MNPTTEELMLLTLKQIAANQRLIINRLFNSRDEAVALAISNTDKLCEALDNGIKLLPRHGLQQC